MLPPLLRSLSRISLLLRGNPTSVGSSAQSRYILSALELSLTSSLKKPTDLPGTLLFPCMLATPLDTDETCNVSLNDAALLPTVILTTSAFAFCINGAQ